MPEYRFFKVKKSGHIDGPAAIYECPGDADAVREAKRLLNGSDIEIWQGPRVVAYLTPDDKH
jgi:hypothetical protein